MPNKYFTVMLKSIRRINAMRETEICTLSNLRQGSGRS